MPGLAAGPVVKTKIRRPDKPYLEKWPVFLMAGTAITGTTGSERWFCLFSPALQRLWSAAPSRGLAGEFPWNRKEKSS
jgi:hypothetical protein